MFLQPSLGTIFWTSIIFFIVLFILKKYAWKPILKSLADREKAIETSINDAKEAEKLISQLYSEKENIISQGKKEKDQLIKEGFDQREKIIADAKVKATIEAQQIVDQARETIKRERVESASSIRAQIAIISVDIAEKLMESDMSDRNKHEQLVGKLIEEIELN